MQVSSISGVTANNSSSNSGGNFNIGFADKFKQKTNVNITSAANVPALASALVGPFALVAQEARRAQGIVSALNKDQPAGRASRSFVAG